MRSLCWPRLLNAHLPYAAGRQTFSQRFLTSLNVSKQHTLANYTSSPPVIYLGRTLRARASSNYLFWHKAFVHPPVPVRPVLLLVRLLLSLNGCCLSWSTVAQPDSSSAANFDPHYLLRRFRWQKTFHHCPPDRPPCHSILAVV